MGHHTSLARELTDQESRELDAEGRWFYSPRCIALLLLLLLPPDVSLHCAHSPRCVITRHPVADSPHPLVVVNVYCPRADPERKDRGRYKQRFNRSPILEACLYLRYLTLFPECLFSFRALAVRCSELRRAGNRVVVVGDVNISHRCL